MKSIEELEDAIQALATIVLDLDYRLNKLEQEKKEKEERTRQLLE